jgi:hypothetical protein
MLRLSACLQVIMQLFHWTRNPAQVSKIAQRKEEIYDSIMNGTQPAEVPGCRGFLDTLRNYNVSALPSRMRFVGGVLHMLLLLACPTHALLTLCCCIVMHRTTDSHCLANVVLCSYRCQLRWLHHNLSGG